MRCPTNPFLSDTFPSFKQIASLELRENFVKCQKCSRNPIFLSTLFRILDRFLLLNFEKNCLIPKSSDKSKFLSDTFFEFRTDWVSRISEILSNANSVRQIQIFVRRAMLACSEESQPLRQRRRNFF